MILHVNSRSAWTIYIALRLTFFAVPFVLVTFVLVWPWWLAVIIATLVSLSLSMIFLTKPREVASESIYAWRMRDRTHDDIFEDDAIDSVNELPENESSTGNAEASNIDRVTESDDSDRTDPSHA
jgi:hypothetical protein